jgi:hypothetical protein
MCLKSEKKFDRRCTKTDNRIGKENMPNVFNLKNKIRGRSS